MRLQLRPLDDGDELLYRQIYSDPRVMRHVANPLSIVDADSSFRVACRQNAAADGREWWVCIERVSGQSIGIVGSTRADDVDNRIPVIEIGVLLLPPWQHCGFAAEAITGLISRIARQQSATVLCLRHAVGNLAMWRLACSLGFHVETDDGAEVCWRRRVDRSHSR